MEAHMGRWRLRPLIISLLLSAALFITYVVPGTASLWHVLDTHFAFAVNGWLVDSPSQQFIWAVGNMRFIDFVAAAIMLCILGHYIVFGSQATYSRRAAQALIISVVLVVLVAITRELVFGHFHHPSPSLVLEPFLRLSKLSPLNFKDASTVSFPGDHATVVATFVFLLWAIAGWRYGLAALIIAIIDSMPRLVVGAHWLTDDVVGGAGTALATVPLVVYTPLAGWLIDRIAPPLSRLGQRVVSR